MGSLIAVAERNRFLNVRNGLANVLAALGLVLIGYSVTAFDSLTPTPSVMTLIPVLGAALIISFSGSAQHSYKTFVAKVLSFKVFVGIGLISYSAYLLHQPLLAFVRIYRFDNMNNGVVAKVVIVTFVMAFLSWRFIEKPFRDKARFSVKSIFTSSIVASLVFILIGKIGVQTDGFKSFYEYRLTDSELLFLDNAYELIENRKNGINGEKRSTCFSSVDRDSCTAMYGKPLVVFGDSHASNVLTALSYSDVIHHAENRGGYHCHPYHYYEVNSISTCDFKGLLDEMEVSGESFRGLVFNQLGAYFIRTSNGDQLNHVDVDYVLSGGELFVDIDRIERNLDYLQEMSKHIDVVWLASWLEPRFPLHMPRKIISYGLNSIYFHPALVAVFKEIDKRAKEYIEKNNLNVKYVTLYDYEKDKNWINIFEGDCVAFSDKDHLSDCGKRIASKYFAKKINDALGAY